MIQALAPAPKLDHVERLSDGTGLIQHATFTTPNLAEGYCTDDNARALQLCVWLGAAPEQIPTSVDNLAERYLGFVQQAFNPQNGRFRNFMSADGRWLEAAGSEDAHGRALWALGTTARLRAHAPMRTAALTLFERAAPAAHEFTSPRAWAFGVLGACELLQRWPQETAARSLRQRLAARLHSLLRQNRSEGWRWFEPILAYDNARLPQALLAAANGAAPGYGADALDCLTWLMDVQRPEGTHLVPIGNDGFYRRHSRRARFDQQPLEAAATVSACLTAWRVTGDDRWRGLADLAYAWFHGANDRGESLYDPRSGGCRDGLMRHGVNANQGAESTLAHLQAWAEIRSAGD